MKILVKIIAASVLLLAGCEEVNDPNEQSPDAGKMNVSVKSAASDSGFMNGDKVGLFVVYDDEVMYNNIDLAMPKLERQIVKNTKKDVEM